MEGLAHAGEAGLAPILTQILVLLLRPLPLLRTIDDDLMSKYLRPHRTDGTAQFLGDLRILLPGGRQLPQLGHILLRPGSGRLDIRVIPMIGCAAGQSGQLIPDGILRPVHEHGDLAR